MVTLSSVVAWKIPWAEEPGGLGSMGLQRVRPDRDKHTLPALGTLSFSHWTTGDVPTVFIYPTSESETVTQHHRLTCDIDGTRSGSFLLSTLLKK